MVDRIRQQNRAYDDLNRTSPGTRFMLFMFPMLLSIVGDMILVVVWGLPSFLYIITMSIMGARRLIGTSVSPRRRT
jgi:hypothetical protein